MCDKGEMTIRDFIDKEILSEKVYANAILCLLVPHTESIRATFPICVYTFTAWSRTKKSENERGVKLVFRDCGDRKLAT